MTIGQLRADLANADSGAALYVLYDGSIVPVESVVTAKNGSIAVIRGWGRPRKSKLFTVTEDGLIGGLNASGESDAGIGELLDRSEDSIKQRRRRLGIK